MARRGAEVPRVAEPAADAALVARALLEHLRRTLDRTELDYAEPPARITGGFDTAIYGFRLARAPGALAGPLVLRLFREEQGVAQARFEAAVHGAVAALGYRAPRVLLTGGSDGELGRAFLLMERVPGRRMLDPMFDPQSLRAPGLLADAQARLHALDAGAFERAVSAAGVSPDRLSVDAELADLEAGSERLSMAGLRGGLRWLAERRPKLSARAICHGDFHPLNVLVASGAVSGVVDWARVRICDPAYDVGVTAGLIRLGPVGLPGFLAPAVAAGRRAFVAAHRRAYARQRALDEDAVRWSEALRCLVILLEVGEHRLAHAGRCPRPSKPTAFGSPRAAAAVVERFRALTGVGVAL